MYVCKDKLLLLLMSKTSLCTNCRHWKVFQYADTIKL